MTCNKSSYTNPSKTDIIINNQNYGYNLNNSLDDVTNLNDLNQTNSFNDNDNDYWQDIKLPHQQSFNYNINNTNNSLINIFNIIKLGKNPLPFIFSSPDLICGLVIIFIVILIILILVNNLI
jgi:hypothetical protein